MSTLAPLRIPIWGESRVAAERAALGRSRVLRGEGIPHGDGAPVLLIPGFLAGDPTLGVMARWLRRIGHRPQRAGITANVDCTELALRRLEDRLVATARLTRRPVAVVGQSRGGSLARVLAVRRPDLISTVVTLGSPLADQFAVHPFVTAHIRAVSFLGSAGVPGMFTRLCEDGPCCADAREQAIGPFPDSVRFVAVYSRSDGIVDWQACLDPAAELVEVRSSHCGMSVHPGVFKVVARSLAPTGTAATVDPPPMRLL